MGSYITHFKLLIYPLIVRSVGIGTWIYIKLRGTQETNEEVIWSFNLSKFLMSSSVHFGSNWIQNFKIHVNNISAIRLFILETADLLS